MSLLFTALINGSYLNQFNRFGIKDNENNHVCERDDKEYFVHDGWKFKCHNNMIMFININQITVGDYPHVTCSWDAKSGDNLCKNVPFFCFFEVFEFRGPILFVPFSLHKNPKVYV
jgi:hypothetical protein